VRKMIPVNEDSQDMPYTEEDEIPFAFSKMLD
jgi:hypothetical protein